jgi:hypothetical protein
MHKLIGTTEEYLRWQITPLLATQWALDDDRLEREFGDAGWDVATAVLAGDNGESGRCCS